MGTKKPASAGFFIHKELEFVQMAKEHNSIAQLRRTIIVNLLISFGCNSKDSCRN